MDATTTSSSSPVPVAVPIAGASGAAADELAGSKYLSHEEMRLLERAKAGEERALRSLYASYQSQVRGHLFRLLGPDSEIDDLVQTVFARAFGALDQFKGNSAFSTWLYRITANTTHNVLRQRFRRNRVKNAFQWFSVSADSHVQRSTCVDARDEAQRVLGLLKPELREVFVLYHYEGLTLQEISNILEKPVSTVGDQLSRSRKKLRDLVSV